MRTLSAQANTERYLDGVQTAWLIVGAFDEYGLSTLTKRWADANFTLGADIYDGLLVEPNGLDIGAVRLLERGGFAPVSRFTLRVRDEEDASAIVDTHVLSNDEVVVYQVFINGSEVDTDKFEIVRGVVERNRINGNVWTLTVKDGSKKLLRDFPVDTLDGARYPRSYEPGQVFPFAFGNLNVGPDDGAGLSPALAPVRMFDKLGLQGTSGWKNKTGTAPFQYYPQANRLAEIKTYAQAGDGTLTVDDPAREVITRPIRTKPTNNETEWQPGVDGDTSTSATLTSGDKLHVYFAGSPKIGKMTALQIEIVAVGSYAYTVKDDTTTRVSPSAGSGNETIVLTLTDWNSWELALMNIEIDGPQSGSTTISDVKCRITFGDFLSLEDAQPDIWQKATGYEDQAANYKDGAVISLAGEVLRNPVHQLEAVLRDKDMEGIEEAKIKAGFVPAATVRNDWKFDWFLREIHEDTFFTDFCFQAGLHMWPSEDGFNVAAMDKSRDPQHFFYGDYHMPAIRGTEGATQWGYDFRTQPIDASRIINELNFRFGLSGPTGEYKKSKIASGQYRLTGTCSTSATASTLTDTGASFVANGVVAGERIYVGGDVDYQVVGSPVSETVLNVTPVGGGPSPVGGGPVSDNTAKTYWLGPNVDGVMLLSQLSFKTVNALGRRQRTVNDDAGFKSLFVQDDATADKFVAHIKEWFAYPCDINSFPVSHGAVNLEVGDVFMMDHPKLKPSKRPVGMTTVAGSHNNSTTTLNVSAATAGLLRVGDWIYVLSATSTEVPAAEAMKVTAVDVAGDNVSVDRGQLNTQAQAFAGGETIFRMARKWMAMEVRPMTPQESFLRVEAVQMPNDYKPVGRVVATGHPDWSSSTEQQRAQSGWATLRNGRVVDLDPDSNVSYVGADSGTYTIV